VRPERSVSGSETTATFPPGSRPISIRVAPYLAFNAVFGPDSTTIMTEFTDPSPASGRKTLGDGAFAVAERVISQVAQFVVFVIAARILGPAEFGVFALVSACSILLLRVAEVGWAPFIMSWHGDATVPRQVLLIAVLCGLIFGALGLAGGGVAAWLFPGGAVLELIVLFSIWIALANASSAQKGIMIWQGRLKASAVCEIVGELTGTAVAIASLYAGHGVLSLAFGKLAMQIVHLTMSFGVTRLAPLPGLRGEVLRDLRIFSTQIFTSRMLANLRLYIATFIIGGALGPAAVGYYRAADRLVSAAAEIIAVPGLMLAWSQLRRARDAGAPEGRTARINREVARFLKVIIAGGAPILLWLAVLGQDLIAGLLSSAWLPAAPVVAILAVARLVSMVGVMTEPLMSISGQSRRLPGFNLMIFVMSTAVTLAAAPFGLYAISAAQVVGAALTLAATIVLFRRHAGTDWSPILADLRATALPLICGLGSLIALQVVADGMAIPPLLRAIGLGLLAFAVYVVATALLDRAFWRSVSAILHPGAPA